MRGRLVTAVLLLMVSFVAPLAATGSARAQDAQADLRDRANAAAAAQQIFQLAADRNFNAMYDLIHPDAHAVVPRAAAVGAFQAAYTQVQAGRAQVLGVTLGPWTWGVTGKNYDRAAEVAFAQPYTDQNGKDAWLSDTMYLVQDDQGAWRWFFGSSPEFVAQAIQQYGSATAEVTPITEGDLITNVVNDLDAFWRDVISYTEFTYQSPKIVVVNAGQAPMTGCGPAEAGNFAGFFCPPDLTIYLDIPFMSGLQPFAAAFVIAHEWAHHIQTGVGLVRVDPGQTPSKWNEVYSIELEIMADCMAGAWAQDAHTRGLLQDTDINQAVDLALQMLGDPNGVGELDPQAHGSGEERAQAIMNGYQNGFLACNVKI
ncbi:MAG TPA: neutral zinc metallopeptidase [Thermomicrobiales bacterium]